MNWTDATAPSGVAYEVVCGGEHVGSRATVAVASGTVVLPAQPQAPEGIYSVKVRAMAARSIGPWSAEAPVFPAPTNASLSWDEPDLVANWQIATRPGAHLAYRVRLYKGTDAATVVGEVTGAAAPGVPIRLSSGAGYAAGESYRVTVASMSGALANQYPTAALTMTFTLGTAPGTTVADYSVQVRAQRPKNWSRWSAAVPIVPYRRARATREKISAPYAWHNAKRIKVFWFFFLKKNSWKGLLLKKKQNFSTRRRTRP